MANDAVNGTTRPAPPPPPKPKPKPEAPKDPQKAYHQEFKDLAGKDGKLSEDDFVKHAKDLGLDAKDPSTLQKLYEKYATTNNAPGEHGNSTMNESEFDKMMASTGAQARIEPYTVKSGDGFIKIATQLGHGHDWQALAKANGLKPDSVIHPGQTLKIPDHWQPDAVKVTDPAPSGGSGAPSGSGSPSSNDTKTAADTIDKAKIDGLAPVDPTQHAAAQKTDSTTLKNAQDALAKVDKKDPQHQALQDKVTALQKAYDAKYPKVDQARVHDKALQNSINDQIKNLDHKNPDPGMVNNIADQLQKNGDPASLAKAAALREMVGAGKGVNGDVKAALINALQDNTDTRQDLGVALQSGHQSPEELKLVAMTARAVSDSTGAHPANFDQMADVLDKAAQPGVSQAVRTDIAKGFDNNNDHGDLVDALGKANSKADYEALQAFAQFHTDENNAYQAANNAGKDTSAFTVNGYAPDTGFTNREAGVLKNVTENYDLYSKSAKWSDFKGHIKDMLGDNEETSSDLRGAVESILTPANMHDAATGKALMGLINARRANGYNDSDTNHLADNLQSLINSPGINPVGSNLDKVLKDGL